MQKLVLCCLGFCVLQVVDGVVKNSFIPLVFCLTHSEDGQAYGGLIAALIALLHTNHNFELGSLKLDIYVDDMGGAEAAFQNFLQPLGAKLHRDLQHVKKNVLKNCSKLRDAELRTWLLDVVEFTAKLGQLEEIIAL